jgi:hypothetical protein
VPLEPEATAALKAHRDRQGFERARLSDDYAVRYRPSQAGSGAHPSVIVRRVSRPSARVATRAATRLAGSSHGSGRDLEGRLQPIRPRQVVHLRVPALTPRGHAALALYRFLDEWDTLDAGDRASLAPLLRELVGDSPPATAASSGDDVPAIAAAWDKWVLRAEGS